MVGIFSPSRCSTLVIKMVVITVEFDKRQYHLSGKMTDWCDQYIGIGGWVYAAPDDWHARNWAISIAFGNTVFYFKDAADATAFALRWK